MQSLNKIVFEDFFTPLTSVFLLLVSAVEIGLLYTAVWGVYCPAPEVWVIYAHTDVKCFHLMVEKTASLKNSSS